MAVPKKKTSKRRSGQRSAANMGVTPVAMTKCSKCGEPKRTHVVCGFCGYYRGKKVVDVKTALDKKLKKENKAEAAE